MVEYLKRFQNVGTVVGLVGLVGSLLLQFGIKVDMPWLSETAQIICAILVVLGVMNNPQTTGLDLPKSTVNTEESK
ncbi:hypothetical protein [Inconstantimicrobium mannanitabidum]|uniref:Uncharacterized protein n=1 Tax=Inconstantimicrobium mannanitabidum TaxID=1604901 RepID=A0ACB5R9N7_9CLOT|nr:hypothetical protein [Clostridium sp. TW13]GKX65847.1 hypothetical protein rsdtw13_11050 [Clostridium sp. TW13]